MGRPSPPPSRVIWGASLRNMRATAMDNHSPLPLAPCPHSSFSETCSHFPRTLRLVLLSFMEARLSLVRSPLLIIPTRNIALFLPSLTLPSYSQSILFSTASFPLTAPTSPNSAPKSLSLSSLRITRTKMARRSLFRLFSSLFPC